MKGTCRVEVDGVVLTALDGQSLAAALVANERWVTGMNPVSEGPRGPYCGMGVCMECEVDVNGQEGRLACLVEVQDGMRVSTRPGR